MLEYLARDPLHLGLIGAGNISRTHARAAAELNGIRISAVYGAGPERVEALAAEFDARPYTDFNRFLHHEPLDFVAIGSPSGLHAEQGIAAARRGLHVLTEKPIDITLDRADALIAACREAGVRLGVCFQDRVAPDLVRVKRMINSGSLGQLLFISAHVRWYRPPEYYSESRWRGTWALDGGGAVINQAIHTLDLVRWLMGPVSRVYAQTATLLHPIETEDACSAVLEFAGGALGCFEATTLSYPGQPRRILLTGSEGTVTVEHNRLVSVQLRELSEAGSVPSERTLSESTPVVSDVAGHRELLADFAAAVREGREPLCPGEEGRKSLELVLAMYESSRRGLPVILGSA